MFRYSDRQDEVLPDSDMTHSRGCQSEPIAGRGYAIMRDGETPHPRPRAAYPRLERRDDR